MNEGEPKPKSKMELLNERMVEEALQELANLDAQALAVIPEETLESERAELVDKQNQEAELKKTAHFKTTDMSQLRPYDLWNSLRTKEGYFDGPNGVSDFNKMRSDILTLLSKIARGGKGSQESRIELYAYLGNVLHERINKID